MASASAATLLRFLLSPLSSTLGEVLEGSGWGCRACDRSPVARVRNNPPTNYFLQSSRVPEFGTMARGRPHSRMLHVVVSTDGRLDVTPDPPLTSNRSDIQQSDPVVSSQT